MIPRIAGTCERFQVIGDEIDVANVVVIIDVEALRWRSVEG